MNFRALPDRHRNLFGVYVLIFSPLVFVIHANKIGIVGYQRVRVSVDALSSVKEEIEFIGNHAARPAPPTRSCVRPVYTFSRSSPGLIRDIPARRPARVIVRPAVELKSFVPLEYRIESLATDHLARPSLYRNGNLLLNGGYARMPHRHLVSVLNGPVLRQGAIINLKGWRQNIPEPNKPVQAVRRRQRFPEIRGFAFLWQQFEVRHGALYLDVANVISRINM